MFQQVLRLGPSRVIVRVETRVRCCPGTGLVHTVPHHGQDDFRVGLAHGLVKVGVINTKGSLKKITILLLTFVNNGGGLERASSIKKP